MMKSAAEKPEGVKRAELQIMARLFLLVGAVILWDCAEYFMDHPGPLYPWEQAALASVVLLMAASALTIKVPQIGRPVLQGFLSFLALALMVGMPLTAKCPIWVSLLITSFVATLPLVLRRMLLTSDSAAVKQGARHHDL
jgi:hypothetical protein